MDDKVIKQIQREGADALLDVGVSVPLRAVKLPFKKVPVELRVTMKRPFMSGQILFARTFLSMGVTSEEVWNYSKEEEMEFLAKHGYTISKMMAYTVCRGWWSRHLLLQPMAWIIRNFVDHHYLLGLLRRFVSLMGTDHFIPIIKSAEMTNPMKLRMSQKRKGS